MKKIIIPVIVIVFLLTMVGIVPVNVLVHKSIANAEKNQNQSLAIYTDECEDGICWEPVYPPSAICINECGDGICEEVVCQAIGCPCSETKASCAKDCKR